MVAFKSPYAGLIFAFDFNLHQEYSIVVLVAFLRNELSSLLAFSQVLF